MDSDLIDLHVHTTASDGTMTPFEIVNHARECGLKAVAITDHDTVDGVAAALQSGAKVGIEVVPGVEIGVDYPGEMHILGYFMDLHNEELCHRLAGMRKNRENRNPRIIAKLRELGVDITIEEVIRAAGGKVIGRPHFASVLREKGYVSSNQEAFTRYLGAGKPAYVKKDKITPQQGIEVITCAGGIPVLAHPGYLRTGSNAGLEELIRTLQGFGLKGIEVYYTTHTSAQTAFYYRMAERNGLLVTGGSDFHGANKPDIKIGRGRGGLAVHYSLLKKLKESKKMFVKGTMN